MVGVWYIIDVKPSFLSIPSEVGSIFHPSITKLLADQFRSYMWKSWDMYSLQEIIRMDILLIHMLLNTICIIYRNYLLK